MNPPNGSKPFDLTAALAGKPVVTRDGSIVTRIFFDSLYPGSLSAYFTSPNGIALCMGVQLNGRACECTETDADLFMAPRTRKVWVNLYGTAREVITGLHVHDSQEMASYSSVSHFRGDRERPFLAAVEIEVPA